MLLRLFSDGVSAHVDYDQLFFNNIKEKDLNTTLDVLINGLHNDLLTIVNHRFHFEEIFGRHIKENSHCLLRFHYLFFHIKYPELFLEPKSAFESSFWHFSKEDSFDQLSCCSQKRRFDDAEVAKRLKVYGPNTIKNKATSSALLLFLSQFKSPVTLLLIIAALLSAGLGDVTDTIIILVIVLISSFLGFW